MNSSILVFERALSRLNGRALRSAAFSAAAAALAFGLGQAQASGDAPLATERAGHRFVVLSPRATVGGFLSDSYLTGQIPAADLIWTGSRLRAAIEGGSVILSMEAEATLPSDPGSGNEAAEGSALRRLRSEVRCEVGATLLQRLGFTAIEFATVATRAPGNSIECYMNPARRALAVRIRRTLVGEERSRTSADFSGAAVAPQDPLTNAPVRGPVEAFVLGATETDRRLDLIQGVQTVFACRYVTRTSNGESEPSYVSRQVLAGLFSERGHLYAVCQGGRWVQVSPSAYALSPGDYGSSRIQPFQP